MTRLCIVRPFAILLFTVLPFSRPAFAELDTYFLGTGRSGSFVVADGSTVSVNVYAPLATPATHGSTTIAIGTLRGGSIGAGDLVMLLQSGGLAPETVTGYAILNLLDSRAGTWELARVASATAGSLTLDAPLYRDFAADAQVVRIPEYSNLTVAGTIAPLPFDGASGGIVAFLAEGSVTFIGAGAIHADGAGFRGGVAVDDSTGSTGCVGDALSPAGAQKGEGVAASSFGMSHAGQNAIANGAGGGDCYLAGGGGGGNAGNGGHGGASDPADGDRNAGGIGGASILASTLDHLFLGGGGGAGHAAHATGGNGGAGGGIVFIRAGAIAGNGIISANGTPGGAGHLDAAGGGGAGGTIHIRSASAIDCEIALSVVGGDGGSVGTEGPGTGGGGGGGFVYYQAQSLTCANPALSGGMFGRNSASSWREATVGYPGAIEKKAAALAQPAPPSISYPLAGSRIAQQHPPISGYGTPGTSVRGYLDGVFVGQYDLVDNFWSLAAPSISLADGPHTLRATTLMDGLESTPAVREFTVDTTPPAAPSITSPASGATVNAHATIAGTTEPNAAVRVTLDSTSWDATADSAGAFALPQFAMNHGAHTISAYATDVAGNQGPPSTSFSFTVDAIPPPTPSASLAGGVNTTNSVHPAFTGSSEAGSMISLKIGAIVETFAGGASWSHTLAATLAAGSYTADVVAIDGVGNESLAAHVAFTVDLTAPAAPQIAKPLANGRANRIEGTAEAGATIFISIDGAENGSAFANGDGAWSFTPVSVGDGAHTVSARARDAAGNFGPSTAAISFTLDRIGPAAPAITSPASGAQTTSRAVTISGTSEGGASILIVASGNLVAQTTTTAAQNGNWTATLNVLGDETYVITAQATDIAGNAGAVSSAIAVRVESRVALTVTAPATAVYGAPVTVTATGTYLLNGQPMTSGSVTFFRDGVAFAVADVVNGAATAVAQLTPGAHTLAATHSSFGTVCCGSANASLVITPAFTRIAIHRSGSSFFAAVTAVAPSVATPEGNVVFTIDGATYTAQLIGGVATIQPARAGGAAHQVAAAYSGTSGFYASSVASVVAPLPAPAPAPPTRRRAAGS